MVRRRTPSTIIPAPRAPAVRLGLVEEPLKPAPPADSAASPGRRGIQPSRADVARFRSSSEYQGSDGGRGAGVSAFTASAIGRLTASMTVEAISCLLGIGIVPGSIGRTSCLIVLKAPR